MAVAPAEVSAIVQAISAVIIVGLTGALTWTAWNALKASRQQATSASAAIAEMQRQRDEMRRQTVLSALPILRVKKPWPEIHQAQLLLTHIELANTGLTPVLGLRLEIRTEDQLGQPSAHVFARDDLSMVVPDESVELAVESRELFNMKLDWQVAQAMQAADQRPPFYHSDRLVLDFVYRTPLGAEVRQQYRWYPDEQSPADETLIWRLMRVTVLPDPANELDIIDVPIPGP